MFGQFDYNSLEQRVLADEYGKTTPFFVLAPIRFKESIQEILHHYSYGEGTYTYMDDVLFLFEGKSLERSPDVTPVLNNKGIPCCSLYCHDLSGWKPEVKQWGYILMRASGTDMESTVKYLTPKYNVGKQLYNHNKHLDWKLLTKNALSLNARKMILGK